MLVAVYTRVSTTEQSEHGYSLQEQEERLRAYCAAMGWTIYKVYTDGGFSGGNTNRPALQQMIQDIQTYKLKKVVVWKLDRLSRSQLDTLYLIEKVFLAIDCDFISMQESFDTATPFGKAMIGMLAVFAQLEREQIKERTMAGRVARAKAGKYFGGGCAPIGYEYTGGELVVNESEAEQVKEVYRLYLSGVPVREIERRFAQIGYSQKHGLWRSKSISSVLSNPIYTGIISFQGKQYPGNHEPIIDPETFAKAQARTAMLRRSPAQSESVRSYLSGLLYCGYCGARYGTNITRRDGKEYRYYCCYSRHRVSEKMIRDRDCKNPNWNMDDLDEIIFSQIKSLVLDPSALTRARKAEPKPDPTAALEKEIQKLDRQLSRLLDLYTVGNISVEKIAERTERLTEQKEKLEQEIERTRSQSTLQPELAIELVRSFADLLRVGTHEEIRAVIVTLIDRIILTGDSVEIHWNF